MLVLQRLLLHPHGSPRSALPHPLALLLLTKSAGKGACQQVKVHLNSQARVHVNRKKYISTVRQRYMSTGRSTSQQSGKGTCQQEKVHLNSQAKVHVNRKKYISTVRQRYMSTGNGTSQQSGKGTCQQVKVQANISNKSATGEFPTLLSLAGAATSIIFVATKFCHNKHMIAMTNVRLS